MTYSIMPWSLSIGGGCGQWVSLMDYPERAPKLPLARLQRSFGTVDVDVDVDVDVAVAVAASFPHLHQAGNQPLILAPVSEGPLI